jgi:hypothetical protein
MSDFGIKVSAPGSSANTGNNLLLTTKYANIKIDSQNPAGFQTITLLITNDTPEPTLPPYATYTVLYKFKHGYTYIPSLETLFILITPPPTAALYSSYFMDYGQIDAHSADDAVYLYAVADATWVYIVVEKYNDGAGSANLLTGTNVKITTHVFVEDVGI